MYSAVLVTPPAVEPLTVAEVKTHLRVDHADEDSYLAGLIVAARTHVEQYTRRALITQEWLLNLDGFPRCIQLPNNPVQSVQAVNYVDELGVAQVLNPTEYVTDLQAAPALIYEGYDKLWPDTYDMPKNVSVEYTCGYGDAGANVPEPIRLALRIMIADWYENRQRPGDVSPAVPALLSPYRLVMM